MLLKIGLILIMVVGSASSSPVRDATSADAFILCCRHQRFLPLCGFVTLQRALGRRRRRRRMLKVANIYIWLPAYTFGCRRIHLVAYDNLAIENCLSFFGNNLYQYSTIIYQYATFIQYFVVYCFKFCIFTTSYFILNIADAKIVILRECLGHSCCNELSHFYYV
jgi:hypothetical protein